MQKRKAVVSLTSLALLLLLFISLFFIFYVKYETDLIKSENLILKTQTYYDMLSFRTQLVQTLSTINSTTSFDSKYDSKYILYLSGNNIRFQKDLGKEIIDINTSFFNLNFCSQTNLSRISDYFFTYNGTCILISS